MGWNIFENHLDDTPEKQHLEKVDTMPQGEINFWDFSFKAQFETSQEYGIRDLFILPCLGSDPWSGS